MWMLGVWPLNTGSDIAEKPWKTAAVSAKDLFYNFILQHLEMSESSDIIRKQHENQSKYALLSLML